MDMPVKVQNGQEEALRLIGEYIRFCNNERI